jgi:hypothetical protein
LIRRQALIVKFVVVDLGITAVPHQGLFPVVTVEVELARPVPVFEVGVKTFLLASA